MNLDIDTRAPDGATADSGKALAIAPVLIRVPALAGRSRRPAVARRPAIGRRSRRRLRREVRVAATAMLCAVPLSWAMLTFGWGRMGALAGDSADGAALAAMDEPPVIAISIEPATVSTTAAPGPARDGAPPVTLEEIVPDLGAEEAAHHAGG